MDDSQKVNADRYLAPETLAQIAPFEMRAKMIVEGVMNGMHRSPFKGLAVEFAEHRQYVPGDEIRHLDWKVYGRTDKLYLKQYQQETNLDTILLVDSSGSMGYGSLESKKGWGGYRRGFKTLTLDEVRSRHRGVGGTFPSLSSTERPDRCGDLQRRTSHRHQKIEQA